MTYISKNSGELPCFMTNCVRDTEFYEEHLVRVILVLRVNSQDKLFSSFVVVCFRLALCR